MFSRDIYIERRRALIDKMEDNTGVVLIPANDLSPNNYPSNHYYFRQDSTFRYLFGLNHPSLWGVIDLSSGSTKLYGDDPTLHDLIWTGSRPTLATMGEEVGVTTTERVEELHREITEALRLGRRVHLLPPYRGETKIALGSLLGVHISQIKEYISSELIYAIADLRERKGREEIEELERSYKIGYQMHTTAMRMTHAGVIEREVGGVLEGIARAMGGGVSFPPIYTQHGERLHNIDREGRLINGRLLLCDAGGETLEGYCSDHTRTYPVSGRFSPAQRDIYSVVLSAQRHITSIARAGMRYVELQSECYRLIGEGLRALGFLKGEMSQIEESGVVSLFMPHGVGHGLGLDVHDCEAMGERSSVMTNGESTSCIVRSKWILQEGTVITNEPGVYFIPELIEARRSEGLYRELVAWDRVAKYLDFGGIRIEDDLVITSDGAYEIGAKESNKIPRTIEEIEAIME